eukprot:5545386-Pyramimonas_sp.AAC.1
MSGHSNRQLAPPSKTRVRRGGGNNWSSTKRRGPRKGRRGGSGVDYGNYCLGGGWEKTEGDAEEYDFI